MSDKKTVKTELDSQAAQRPGLQSPSSQAVHQILGGRFLDSSLNFMARSLAGTLRVGEGLALLLCVSVCVSLSLSACNLYSSSDRKSFNSNAGTSASAAQKSQNSQDEKSQASSNIQKKNQRLSISQRTHCTQVESAAPLLLRGVDIVHAAEAWNVEADDRTQSYRFVWARRSENSAGVLCLIEPLTDYELQHTLSRLPTLASHLSAELP